MLNWRPTFNFALEVGTEQRQVGIFPVVGFRFHKTYNVHYTQYTHGRSIRLILIVLRSIILSLNSISWLGLRLSYMESDLELLVLAFSGDRIKASKRPQTEKILWGEPEHISVGVMLDNQLAVLQVTQLLS